MYVGDGLDIIKSRISEECRLDMLAEESAELAQAALKLSRIMRGENPSGTSKEAAISNLVEEFTDVILSAELCDLTCDMNVRDYKVGRCLKRLGYSDMGSVIKGDGNVL